MKSADAADIDMDTKLIIFLVNQGGRRSSRVRQKANVGELYETSPLSPFVSTTG